MPNPFYVHPGGDMSEGLKGLTDIIAKKKEKKRIADEKQAELDRVQKLKDGALEAYKSGDPEKIREYMIQNPEMADNVEKTINAKIPGDTKDLYLNSLFKLLLLPVSPLILAAKAPELLSELKAKFAEDGIDQQESDQLDKFEQLLNSDPNKARSTAEAEFALMADADLWKKYQDVSKTKGSDPKTLMAKFIKDNPDATTDDMIAFKTKLESAGKADSRYKGLSTDYATYLSAHDLDNSPKNYSDFNKKKVEMKRLMETQKADRPYITGLMADGWMPSQRITGPMLDAYEAMAKRADENGTPFDVESLYKAEFEAQKNRATGRTAGGRLTLARKQNIESAHGLLKDMKETASKLKYSGVKMIGAFQKYVKGQLNDPIFTEYMTQRADALFALAAALKQNGVTDKSIEVEEEAFNPTLSPKAFNGWLNTQVRALNRAAEEMNRDFDFGITPEMSFPAGQGGNPTPENPEPTLPEDEPSVSKYKEGQTATGPNGKKLIFTNGSWEEL